MAPVFNPDVPNIFEMSSGAYGSGVGGMEEGAGIIGETVVPNALPMSINAMMNPYLDNVINNAVTRMRERRDLDLNRVQSDAAQASAFGGARHGLVESELIDAYGQQEDDLVSRLLQQGFDTSSNLAMSDLSRRANAGSAIAGIGGQQVGAAGAGFDLGSRALASQAAAGSEQQNLVQQILSGAAGETRNYLDHPMKSLTAIMAGLAGNPLNRAGTTTQNVQMQHSPLALLAQGLGGLASIGGGGK